MTENTRLTLLKGTVGYIPALTVCLILIKQQKVKRKTLSALDWRKIDQNNRDYDFFHNRAAHHT